MRFSTTEKSCIAHVKNYDNFHTCRFSPFHRMAYFKEQFMKVVLTRLLRSLVRYRFEHSQINFISPRAHVLFSIY